METKRDARGCGAKDQEVESNIDAETKDWESFIVDLCLQQHQQKSSLFTKRSVGVARLQLQTTPGSSKSLCSITSTDSDPQTDMRTAIGFVNRITNARAEKRVVLIISLVTTAVFWTFDFVIPFNILMCNQNPSKK